MIILNITILLFVAAVGTADMMHSSIAAKNKTIGEYYNPHEMVKP